MQKKPKTVAEGAPALTMHVVSMGVAGSVWSPLVANERPVTYATSLAICALSVVVLAPEVARLSPRGPRLPRSIQAMPWLLGCASTAMAVAGAWGRIGDQSAIAAGGIAIAIAGLCSTRNDLTPTRFWVELIELWAWATVATLLVWLGLYPSLVAAHVLALLLGCIATATATSRLRVGLPLGVAPCPRPTPAAPLVHDSKRRRA